MTCSMMEIDNVPVMQYKLFFFLYNDTNLQKALIHQKRCVNRTEETDETEKSRLYVYYRVHYTIDFPVVYHTGQRE